MWKARGNKTRTSKDSVSYYFKNGSVMKNIAATEKSRGLRFHAGLLEECVTIDQNVLNEVLIPTMNVSRYVNGDFRPAETLNKSQCYITTAGYKNTFSYEKLIQILVQSVINPTESIILGGSWRVPVMEKLLDKNFVRDLKMDGTFNDASFEREYESKWSGDAENAFFNSDVFDKHRIMLQPEYKYSDRSSKHYYIMGVDVGRTGCTTEVCVFKVSPQPHGTPLKSLVNIYSFEEEHFGSQTIKLKRLFNAYKCKAAVVDGNGLGIGLIDMLTMDQVDPDTGDDLWNWGVINDDDGVYKNMRTDHTIRDALYVMKANQTINTDCHSYAQNQLSSGKIRFLIDESSAKIKLMEQKQGQKMKPEKRAEYLQPFVMTTILREQMLNLVESNEGAQIILKTSNGKIKKDKFSAFEYGLYYCKLKEDKERQKKKRNISDFILFSSNSWGKTI